MKFLLASLLLCPLVFLQDKASLVDAPMPGPTETFNLQFHLLRAGKMEAVLGLVLDEAIDEEARATYRELAEMTKSRGFNFLAFDEIVEDDMAAVLLLDVTPKKRSIDVDPCYLIRRDGMWRVLPTFGTPRGELKYLSEDERGRLKKIQAEFRKKKKAEMKRLKEKAKG